jgi:hypothetical protein
MPLLFTSSLTVAKILARTNEIDLQNQPTSKRPPLSAGPFALARTVNSGPIIFQAFAGDIAQASARIDGQPRRRRIAAKPPSPASIRMPVAGTGTADTEEVPSLMLQLLLAETARP